MNMTADTMLRDPPLATRDRYHALEREYGARNYKPIDVVLTRGLGVWVWRRSPSRRRGSLSPRAPS